MVVHQLSFVLMENLVISFPISLIIFFASFVQGATGFGFGIVSIPLLTLFYLSPEIALPLSAMAAVSQSIVGIVQYRKLIKVKEILLLSFYCLVGLVFGVLVLRAVTRFNQDLFSILIGIILIILVTMKKVLKIEPRESIPAYWGIISLFAGGFISGLAGVGGPVIVLWVMAHKWDNIRSRLTLWSVFLSMTLLQTVLYSLTFGIVAFRGVISGFILIPVVMIASLLGIYAGNRLDEKKLEIAVIALVYIMSIYSIVKPFI